MVSNKDISTEKRKHIIQFLLQTTKNGKPAYGRMKAAEVEFQVSPHSVKRLWKAALAQINSGQLVNVLNCRKSRIYTKIHEIDYAQIQQIDVHKRGTIEGIAEALHISKSTVGRWTTNHLLRPHTNSIRPLLTAPNKIVRLSFSLKAIHYDEADNICRFRPMENIVHIDEKWFYLTRKSCRFYLTPMEADPLRVTQSKNFIPKVMFMCAVSRPVFDVNGTCLFDGKIGIWPFVEEVTALRDSINRKKGTKEMKPIQSITREVIKKSIINQIIPAIKQKWPACLSRNISIQQDNARTHIQNSDPDFQRVANADDYQINLVQQPPNSPDCNTLDLGFFNAIQSLQQRIKCKNAADLIAAVENSFMALDPMTLNKVFLSLQCVLVEIMKVKGANNYKTPHMKKDSLLRQGLLPQNLQVSIELVKESIEYLIGEDSSDDIQALMESVGITQPYNGDGIPDLNL